MEDIPVGEIWRPIVGYERAYDVSDWGNVCRIAGGMGARAGRILKPVVRKDGRLQVTLSLCRKQTRFLVSRLVADAFLPTKCPTDTVVRHLNDDPSDNRAVNLARGTYADNAADAIRNEKMASGIDNGRAKLTENQVREIRLLYATGKFSQQELALRFGVSQRTISSVVGRRIWKHVV